MGLAQECVLVSGTWYSRDLCYGMGRDTYDVWDG